MPLHKSLLFLFLLFLPHLINCQVLTSADTITKETEKNLQFSTKQLIAPVALMTYGVIATQGGYLNQLNLEIRDELKENIDEKITIDDFTQYVPLASVFALNALGIQGRHSLKEQVLIGASSYLMMTGTVMVLKSTTKIERPDNSAFNSFPSGHTATAFAGAEFLWQEYRDVSIWYGISGYVVAAGTGFFRIYNGRHWCSDVAMGAGIGILTTKIAYWIYPYTSKILFKSSKKISSNMTPFYDGKRLGVGMILNFN